MTAKETILRLLETDSVKDCGNDILEVLEEMRYRYELERKVIKIVESLPGYQGDESVEAVHTRTLEMILQSFEKHGVD